MSPRKWFWLFTVATLLGSGTVVQGADTPAAPRTAEFRAVVERIDKYLADGWSTNRVEPAPQADDAEFLRRVYLDLVGRIPSVTEVREFLQDSTPDKRERVVEQLLNGPRYITHWTNVWRALLLPETLASRQARVLAPGFETWMREQLAQNVAYDVLVRDLLTTPVDPNNSQRMAFARGQSRNPLAYFTAKETKPENVAAAVSRAFLGFRLECAQCHDHPFAEWKREQFWNLAAFFSGMEQQTQAPFQFLDVVDRRELTIPGTERVVQAKFPDGSEPNWQAPVNTRQTLAEWVTAPQNPFFARAAVNRMWYQLFGRGLVEPVDEMFGGASTTSESRLLDDLAAEFAAHHFDLKFLIRALTATRAYQLSSAGPQPGPNDLNLFARMPLRGLTVEQLLDSLVQATGHPDSAPRDPRFGFGTPNPRDELLANFVEQSDQPTDSETTILQALSMMNGRLVADESATQRSNLLASILDAPFLDTPQKVETMYLAALSRKPKPKEQERAARFIQENPELTETQALADLFWALLNSGEFLLNH